MDRKKILVVVDYQYDFFNPNGALYVNGGEKLQDKIEAIIPNFDKVFFTLDSHPLNHCSFKDNGGQWPTHCVMNTIGNGMPVSMMKLAKYYTFVYKGEMEDMEEYGAWSDEVDFSMDIGMCWDIDEMLPYEKGSDYDEYLKKHYEYVDEIVVCGIAGDYCVLETLKNIVKFVGTYKVSVYLDGVVSIDGGVALTNYMNENNIKVYK